MRLTLRTLLAYLDDILDPAQTKEIGVKIAENDLASSLVNRIREVTRRRRLTAPDLDGPGAGLNANRVSEYLDNTLSPDAVADIEKVCLDSDVHLAEVAACHQILTLVLGEPVEISGESRERMYALGPVVTVPSEETAPTFETPSPEPQPAAEPVRAAQSPLRSFSESIPDYLKRKPIWKRLLPYTVVVVLLAAFTGLVLTDETLFPGFFADGEEAPTAKSLSGTGSQLALKQPGPNDASSARSTVSEKGAVSGKRAVSAKVPKERKAKGTGTGVPPTAGIDKKAPPDAPETHGGVPAKSPAKNVGQKKSPIVKPPVKLPNPKTVASKKPSPKGMPPVKTKKAKPAAVARAATKIEYSSPGGRSLFFRYDAKAKDWFALSSPSLIGANEWLAAPEPFNAVLKIGPGQWRVTLLSGTSVRTLPPTAAAGFGFKLRKGRIVIRRQMSARSGKAKSVRFALQIGGNRWRIDLLTAETVCGIEMQPLTTTAFEQSLGTDNYSGRIFVTAGAVRFADRNGEVVVMNARGANCGRLSLKPSDLVASRGNRKDTVEYHPSPSWMVPGGRRVSEQVRRDSLLYLREFETDADAAGPAGLARVSMLQNATAIVRDRRAGVAEFAVRTLDVTGSYGELVRALSVMRDDHEEAREAAINGLRTWLPSDRKNGRLLKIELARIFTKPDADSLYRLLWGYSEKDLRDQETSLQLVEWLANDRIAIRELAFLHIHRLTRKRFEYRPTLASGQLRLAVNRWRNYIDKHGALLKKKTEASP